MKSAIAILILLTTILAGPLLAQPTADPTQEILALERQAMDGWSKGDPDPVLAITDPQVTFIHDGIGVRLQGLPALKALYDQYRGTPLFESYEIRNPLVQTIGDAAILTYLLAQHVGGSTRYWNGTEIFQRTKLGWRIVHSHWSTAKIP